MGMFQRRRQLITAHGAGLGSAFRGGRAGSVGGGILPVTAHGAFVPVILCIFGKLCTIPVRHIPGFPAEVAVGVAIVVIAVGAMGRLSRRWWLG